MKTNDETQILQQLKESADFLAVSGHTCRSPGLSDGKMGTVIFLYHYARQSKDASYEKTAESLIDEIRTVLHANSPLSYAYGLTGIGAGIEYLAQQGFANLDTDDMLEDFDRIFAEQIHQRKLYLSYQNIKDMKRYFLARSENPQTKKRDFLAKAVSDMIALLALHDRVRDDSEESFTGKTFHDSSVNPGLDGLAGKGLALLSELNPQHTTLLFLL